MKKALGGWVVVVVVVVVCSPSLLQVVGKVSAISSSIEEMKQDLFEKLTSL